MLSIYSQIILFQILFVFILYFLTQFILKRDSGYKIRLIILSLVDIIFAIIIYFQVLINPIIIGKLNFTFIFWLFAGFIMTLSVLIQIMIFIKIYKSRRDDKVYHYNVFGGKVLKKDSIPERELWVFLSSIPFFLLPGAYFVARLINYFLYNHL